MPLRYIPIELLKDKNLSAAARLIYCVIRAAPPVSIRDLSKFIGMERNACRLHCHALLKAGWIGMDRDKYKRRYLIYPKIPPEVQKRMVAELIERLEIVGFLGEALMRAWLDFLLNDDDYLDNFRPKFLVNPRTGELLEYDRLHPRLKAAFEFNGPQHYRRTRKHSSQEELDDQKTRDLVKKAISMEQGIRLIVIEAKDLTLQGMLAKLQGLPLRRFDANGPYIRALEKLSRQYMLKAEAEAEAAKQRLEQYEER